MCGVAIGDLTKDGPEIYFSHYEQQAQVDLNDRLLINDEATSSATRASPHDQRHAWLGTSAVIDDMNLDGQTM